MGKYLITGGAGFIGSHLTNRMIENGHKVVVWDDLSTGNKKNVNEEATFYHTDVAALIDRDEEEAFDSSHWNGIFHLAAEARIQPSFKKPAKTHLSNVTGTVKMLEMAKRVGTKLVYAGSSSVYHDVYANPYTFTKHKAEEYCELYTKLFDVDTAICRFFNVYGPRQLETSAYATVLGIFERQKREGQPLTITGDGEQRRDFTHVSDIVEGLIAAMQRVIVTDDGFPPIFNLGTGTNHSINEVAALFGGPTEYLDGRPGEARDTLADISVTKELLKWEPKVKLEDYIRGLKQLSKRTIL